MGPRRTLLSALLALACRRDAPPAAPPADVPRAAPAPRPFGLIASVLSATAPSRGDAGWSVTLNLSLSNTGSAALAVGPGDVHVSRGEDAAVGTIAASGWEGPSSLAPGASETVRVTAVFPPTPDAPYEVVLRVASQHANNRPVLFPLPSAPPAPR